MSTCTRKQPACTHLRCNQTGTPAIDSVSPDECTALYSRFDESLGRICNLYCSFTANDTQQCFKIYMYNLKTADTFALVLHLFICYENRTSRTAHKNKAKKENCELLCTKL